MVAMDGPIDLLLGDDDDTAVAVADADAVPVRGDRAVMCCIKMIEHSTW